MKKNIETQSMKIGLLGDSGVGKTNIINSILNVDFNEEEISTISLYKFEIKVILKKDNEVKLIVWDTSGQERFRSLAIKTIKNIDGIILVFDVTNRSSFKNISNWLRLIKENKNLILFYLEINLM